jgi:hypothetical protein
MTTHRITAPKSITPITTTEAAKAYRSGLGDSGLGQHTLTALLGSM